MTRGRQLENAGCGFCSCRCLIGDSGSSVGPASTADRYKRLNCWQRAESLESMVAATRTPPLVCTKAYLSHQTDAKRHAHNISMHHNLQPSTSRLNNSPCVSGSSPGFLDSRPTHTEDIQIVSSPTRIHAESAKVVVKSHESPPATSSTQDHEWRILSLSQDQLDCDARCASDTGIALCDKMYTPETDTSRNQSGHHSEFRPERNKARGKSKIRVACSKWATFIRTIDCSSRSSFLSPRTSHTYGVDR